METQLDSQAASWDPIQHQPAALPFSMPKTAPEFGVGLYRQQNPFSTKPRAALEKVWVCSE